LQLCGDLTIRGRDAWHDYGSAIRDQAFLLSALSEQGKRNEAYRLFLELRAQFSQSQVWLSTQEQGALLLGFADFLKGNVNSSENFTLEVRQGNGSWKKGVSSFGLARISLDANDSGTIQVRIPGQVQGHFAQVQRRGIAPLLVAGSQGGLQLSVEAYDPSGQALDLKGVSQGQEVSLRIKIENRSRAHLGNLACTLPIAGAFEIRNPRLMGEGSLLFSSARYLDIRDDKAVWHFDLQPGEKKTFAIGLTAAYTGLFHRPGVTVEDLYDPTYRAYQPGGSLRVAPSEN